MKKLILGLALTLLFCNQAIAGVTWGNDVLSFDAKHLRKVAFSQSFFNGYYIRTDLVDIAGAGVNLSSVSPWRYSRSLAKNIPVIQFGQEIAIVPGWVSTAIVSGDGTGRLYFVEKKLTQQGWLAAISDFENWNLASGKCSLWYQDSKNKVFTCAE